jgi:hypothetical protein
MRHQRVSLSPINVLTISVRPLNFRTGWGRSSVGRAPQWHCGGQGFESPRLHHPRNQQLTILGRWVTTSSNTNLRMIAISKAKGIVAVGWRGKRQRASDWRRLNASVLLRSGSRRHKVRHKNKKQQTIDDEADNGGHENALRAVPGNAKQGDDTKNQADDDKQKS